jgi:spore cortex biosynthesis protein YabQ
VSLDVQFLTMAWMAGCGALLGAAFDTVNVTARRFRFGRGVRSLLDVLYWVAATLLVFRVLVKANGGVVRPFVFLGLGIGAVLYLLLAAGLYRRTVDRLLAVLTWLYGWTVRVLRALVWRPLLWIVRTVRRFLRWVWRITTRVTVAFGRSVLKWSRLFWKRLRFRRR